MATTVAGGEGHPVFIKEAEALKELHQLKSGGYGTSNDPFANFTAITAISGQERWVYAQHRSVEKAARVLSLTAQKRYKELAEEFRDQAGLALCCLAMFADDYPHNYGRP